MLVSLEPVDVWITRVRAEYVEMPGMSLTKCQMCRLWHIDADTCDAVVGALLASGFLRDRQDEKYVRNDDSI
jgi:hypothetical protein